MVDFKSPYTKEQQVFRAAVRAWLIEHFPQDLTVPPDGSPLDAENQDRVKEFRRKLGEKRLAGSVMAAASTAAEG